MPAPAQPVTAIWAGPASKNLYCRKQRAGRAPTVQRRYGDFAIGRVFRSTVRSRSHAILTHTTLENEFLHRYRAAFSRWDDGCEELLGCS
jgi:hypothetical protein